MPPQCGGAVERHIFGHKSDARFDPSFGLRHIVAEHCHAAGIGPDQAHQNAQQSGLACALAANQAKEFESLTRSLQLSLNDFIPSSSPW
jgi:hypothetical protein